LCHAIITVAKQSLSTFIDTEMSLFLAIGLLLKVIKKNGQSACLFTEVGNDSTTGPDSFLHLTISIKLGQSAPCTQILAAINHDDGDFTLSAESADELLVLLVFAVLSETAETGRAAVESLGAFVKSLTETVMNKGLFENLDNNERIRC